MRGEPSLDKCLNIEGTFQSRMVSHNELSRLATTLQEGFFADSVVGSLKNTKAPLNRNDTCLLRKVINYMDIIENGRKQVSTGHLTDDAITSINAYNRMLSMILANESKQDKDAISKLTNTIRKEVKSAMSKNEIVPSKLSTTIRFFDFIRDASLSDSALNVGWEKPIIRIVNRTP